MTLKQRLVKAFYPIQMGLSKQTGVGQMILSAKELITPPVSFHNLHAIDNVGKPIGFNQYFGKKLLIVNLASQCSFTPQYKELEKIYEQYHPHLEILGFPTNDFGHQEPGTNEDIAAFCETNYHIRFPLFQKASVKGPTQQAVYQWLTHNEKNGWNKQEPTWNFCKYLIDEEGRLTHFFSAAVSPLSEKMTRFLQF